MLLRAKVSHIRVSPKKVRRLANIVRNKGLMESINILKLLRIVNKKYLLKLLESVKANARIKNPDVDLNALHISKIIVNEGSRLKRMKPRARGRADVIKKRLSHIEVEVEMPEKVLEDKKDKKDKKAVKTTKTLKAKK